MCSKDTAYFQQIFVFILYFSAKVNEMAKTNEKLVTPLKKLFNEYMALEGIMDKDDDSEHAHDEIVGSLEAAIEAAIEAEEIDTQVVARMLSFMTEALESLDPEAFEADEEDDDDYEDEDEDEDDYEDDED